MREGESDRHDEFVKREGNSHRRLIQGLLELDISPSSEQLEQLDRFYEILIDWNEKMNLTAITDYGEVVVKHFIDSVSLVKAFNLREANMAVSPLRILDMGTGAGFPGIPLKILFPNISFVLMDSLNKRIVFLQEVIRELDLKEISAVHARAEEYARKPEYRQRFDLCVSRAVAKLNTLSEFCLPFVKNGGEFISYKSGGINEELKESEKAVRVLGGIVRDTISFTLPETDINRTFVCIKKIKDTPKGYPRAGGKAVKMPIVS